MDLLRTFVDRLLDLVAGSRCPGCGTAAVDAPCRACRAALVLLPRTRGGVWPDDRGVAGRLVRSAKHGTWRRGHVFFAAAAARRVRGAGAAIDLVTWVPADPRRRARRGGCLPERFARVLARGLGVPCVQLVDRVPGSGSQRGRDRAGRIRNAVRSYRWRTAAPTLADVSRVLVVDDVRTTGATLEAVASLVRAHAPAGCRVSTLAIVAVDRAAMESATRGVTNRASRFGKAAPSAEFPLTNPARPADTLCHDQ